MSKIVEIWKNTTDELVNKVTWPSWDELRSSTTIVLIASILFALVILLIDKENDTRRVLDFSGARLFR